MKLTVKRRRRDLLITLTVPWKRRPMSDEARANMSRAQKARGTARVTEGALRVESANTPETP